MKTILEFNEEQQMFHYNPIVNDVPKDAENRFGWQTLIVCDSEEQVRLFADFLYTQHLKNKKATFAELERTILNLTKFLSFFISNEVATVANNIKTNIEDNNSKPIEIIDKILSEKVISRSSNLASSEIIENIINHIVKTDENQSLRFNEKISADEKIDIYLDWKEMCTGIIETHIKTDNYSFKHYACFFLDGLIPICLTYIFYENKFYDISHFMI